MKRRSDYLGKNLPWLLGAAVSVAILVILIIVVWPEKTVSTDLEVDEVYFSTKELGGTDTDLEILVFITNEGDDDVSKVEIRAFAVETDSNIARDEARAELSGLKAKTSKEGKLYITIPNNDTYRIEILIFEEGKLSIRGSGTVDLTGVGSASDYRTEGGSGDDDAYDTLGESTEDASAAGVFICLFMGAIGIVVLIVIVVAVTRKKVPAAAEEKREFDLLGNRMSEDDAQEKGNRPTSRRTELRFERPKDEEIRNDSAQKELKEEN